MVSINQAKNSQSEQKNQLASTNLVTEVNSREDSTLEDIFGLTLSANDFYNIAKQNGNNWLYTVIDPQDWYKIYPYQIVIRKKPQNNLTGGSTQLIDYIYTLPIPPEVLDIQMIPASVVTPTINGVTEETSATVFWNINMLGTLGLSTTRAKGQTNIPAGGTAPTSGTAALNTSASPAGGQNNFRNTLSKTGLLSGVVSTIAGALNQANSAATDIQNVLNGNTDELGNLLSFTSSLPYTTSAVNGDPSFTNGYTEINHLHKFMITYGLMKEKFPDQYEMLLVNQKDQQRWRVILTAPLRVSKTAQSPYLYRYSMSFKGWNMTNSDGFTQQPVDRFGPNGDLRSVSTLSITGAITGARTAVTGLKSVVSNPIGSLLRSPVI